MKDEALERAVLGEDVGAFVASMVALRGKGPALEFLTKVVQTLQEYEELSNEKEQSEEEGGTKREINGKSGLWIDSKERKARHHGQNTINSFEVLDTVFRHLDYQALCKASEVCKAWRNLALDPSFWSLFGPTTNSRMVLPPLTAPSLPSSPPSSPTSHSPSPHLPSSWDLTRLIRLPRFNLLHWIDFTPWKDEVDDEWIACHLTHLQKLRHLRLFDCKKVQFAHPGLTKLTGLTSLDVGALHGGQLISNESLAVMEHLTNLRKIDLHYCEKINDYGLHHIAALPKLQFLDLGNCYRLTSFGISKLAPLSTTLTWLSLKSPVRSNFSIKDDGLRHLSNFSRLTHLDIGYCKRITDEGMQYIAHLKALSHLGLAATSITDAGVVCLRNLKNIRVFDVTHCTQLTMAAPKIITINYPLLRRVFFKGIPLGNHSTWGLMGLRECPNLEEIDFTNTYIDDQMLEAQYTKAGVSIKTMNLSYCSGITDEGVKSVCINLPMMENLILSHCHRLTDEALGHMLIPRHLTRVDISGIYSFTTSALEQLQKARPNIKIVR